jgi:hypothetical protein
MRTGLRFRLLFVGALALAGFVTAGARGADDPKKDKDDNSKPVKFSTIDGVTLEGTFFPADPQPPEKKKDATVLMLHAFDRTKGGDSGTDEWQHLAKEFQKRGYSVLTFDFRGYGNSHTVDVRDFWDLTKNPHNRVVKGAEKIPNPPETIRWEDFKGHPEYYPYLVNDVAAAKEFLDRRPDADSSNLIVVGAGEGATLGAMWMASEWHRQRLSGVDERGRPKLDKPEGQDILCAIWISMSPSLGGRGIGESVVDWVKDVSGENRVPMYFLYGDKDARSKEFAARCVKDIKRYVRDKNSGMSQKEFDDYFKKRWTGEKGVEGTDLVGTPLLAAGDPPAEKLVLDTYLKPAVEEFGHHESRSHDDRDFQFVWRFGTVDVPAKLAKEEGMHLIPISRLLRGGE